MCARIGRFATTVQEMFTRDVETSDILLTSSSSDLYTYRLAFLPSISAFIPYPERCNAYNSGAAESAALINQSDTRDTVLHGVDLAVGGPSQAVALCTLTVRRTAGSSAHSKARQAIIKQVQEVHRYWRLLLQLCPFSGSRPCPHLVGPFIPTL